MAKKKTTTTKMLSSAMSANDLISFETDFAGDSYNAVLQNAITETSVRKLAVNRKVVEGADHTFSHRLDDWKVTNQKMSGRCWIFAGVNLLRVGASKKMKLNGFEFSQNYVMFWDKFEKANHFLEAMIKTADRDIDDRTVSFLLKDPIGDGGQWNMFVNVINKYGLVPKSAMPESESSSSTNMMNHVLVSKLRSGAQVLRKMYAKKATAKGLRAAKKEMMNDIYRVLALHLGNPPKKVNWQWREFRYLGKM